MGRKKVLIDCDPGMDDSMAIIMACKSSELEVKAITTVMGNYPVETTARNARKILELIGRTDIPVAKGMGRPMTRPAPKDPFTHGKDGQADANLPEPKMPLSENHAIDLIIDTINANPDEIYILATAPLTNIAMALLKAPEIKNKIAGIYAISGAFGLNEYAFLNATGDTPQSDWNVYVDPEAAEVVYNAGLNFVALGLDVSTHFDVNFTADDMIALKTSRNKEAQFLENAIRFIQNRGFDAYCAIIDCMAVGYAIDPTLIRTIRARVGIETKSGLTLGMTVRDGRHHHVWEQLPLINIGAGVDYERFLRLIMKLFLA